MLQLVNSDETHCSCQLVDSGIGAWPQQASRVDCECWCHNKVEDDRLDMEAIV